MNSTSAGCRAPVAAAIIDQHGGTPQASLTAPTSTHLIIEIVVLDGSATRCDHCTRHWRLRSRQCRLAGEQQSSDSSQQETHRPLHAYRRKKSHPAAPRHPVPTPPYTTLKRCHESVPGSKLAKKPNTQNPATSTSKTPTEIRQSFRITPSILKSQSLLAGLPGLSPAEWHRWLSATARVRPDGH